MGWGGWSDTCAARGVGVGGAVLKGLTSLSASASDVSGRS